MKMWGVCVCVCVCWGGGVYISLYIYTYTMECCSAMKKNEILSLVATWMDLEHIVLNKISQRKPTTV